MVWVNTIDCKDEMKEKIFAALTAHTAWKQRLAQAIDAGIIDPPPSVIAEDNLCVFGKWLYGEEISIYVKQLPEYEEVRQIHAHYLFILLLLTSFQSVRIRH